LSGDPKSKKYVAHVVKATGDSFFSLYAFSAEEVAGGRRQKLSERGAEEILMPAAVGFCLGWDII
jgi:hypothetical protein